MSCRPSLRLKGAARQRVLHQATALFINGRLHCHLQPSKPSPPFTVGCTKMQVSPCLHRLQSIGNIVTTISQPGPLIPLLTNLSQLLLLLRCHWFRLLCTYSFCLLHLHSQYHLYHRLVHSKALIVVLPLLLLRFRRPPPIQSLTMTISMGSLYLTVLLRRPPVIGNALFGLTILGSKSHEGQDEPPSSCCR